MIKNMCKFKKIYENFDLDNDEKNDTNQINKAEEELKILFPKEYTEFLLEYHGGSGEIGEYYIDMWSLEDVIDFYDECTETGLEELVVFASDGGGMGYAFDKKNNSIRIIPMDSLEYEYSKKCSDNFENFIQDMLDNKLIEY